MGPFMAIRRQSLINLSLIPGALASGLLVSVALLAFGALWLFSPETSWSEIFSDRYL